MRETNCTYAIHGRQLDLQDNIELIVLSNKPLRVVAALLVWDLELIS